MDERAEEGKNLPVKKSKDEIIQQYLNILKKQSETIKEQKTIINLYEKKLEQI